MDDDDYVIVEGFGMFKKEHLEQTIIGLKNNSLTIEAGSGGVHVKQEVLDWLSGSKSRFPCCNGEGHDQFKEEYDKIKTKKETDEYLEKLFSTSPLPADSPNSTEN